MNPGGRAWGGKGVYYIVKKRGKFNDSRMIRLETKEKEGEKKGDWRGGPGGSFQ